MGLAELTRNAVHVLPAGGLEQKLKLDRPLRVKLGIDVTSPDIHIGRGIPLQRMRAFQDAASELALLRQRMYHSSADAAALESERVLLDTLVARRRDFIGSAMV